MLKGSTLLKENLCIYKCFIDVLYLSDRVFKRYWEMVVPISPDILLKASSCLCPTCFKQNSACTSAVAWYFLVVIKAGYEHPVLEDPSDFIALFSRVLETNVPVLAQHNNDFVWCLAILSARCFTYQLFVILSSSFFHFLNSATSLNVLHLQIDHDDYWGGVFNHWVRKSCSGDTRIIKSLELVTHSLCGTWQLLK